MFLVLLYREASEKLDRPLSRLRPEAIPEERATLKETSRAVSRCVQCTISTNFNICS